MAGLFFIALSRPRHIFRLTIHEEHTMVRPLSVLFAVLAIAGCSSSTDPASDILSAHAENRTLTLVNGSNDPVYYFVADADALALIDWQVCLEPSKCTAVPPKSTKSLAYSEIAAYQEGSGNALVYHWRIITKATGGNDYDSLRKLAVKLR
jgi:hypothetical protein